MDEWERDDVLNGACMSDRLLLLIRHSRLRKHGCLCSTCILRTSQISGK